MRWSLAHYRHLRLLAADTNAFCAGVHDDNPSDLTVLRTELGEMLRGAGLPLVLVRSVLTFPDNSAMEAIGLSWTSRRSPRSSRGLNSFGRPLPSLRTSAPARRAMAAVYATVILFSSRAVALPPFDIWLPTIIWMAPISSGQRGTVLVFTMVLFFFFQQAGGEGGV